MAHPPASPIPSPFPNGSSPSGDQVELAAAPRSLPRSAPPLPPPTPHSARVVTSFLHGDERKQLCRVSAYGLTLCIYLLGTILLPIFLSATLARHFGLLPATNLIFVGPVWLVGVCLWRAAGDSRSATIFGLGWVISAFASFALGWGDMQSWATVVRGISVRDWSPSEGADGYYFTDGYVGSQFQVTGHQRKCVAQRCSEYSWSLAPVFASPTCALLNVTREVEHRVYNMSSNELIATTVVKLPRLSATEAATCNVLFIAMQVVPGGGIIGSIAIGATKGAVKQNEWVWPDPMKVCGDESSGGLCTRLSPYSPHACEPALSSNARLPDPTLLGCSPRETCRSLMEQSFIPPSDDVCDMRYFAIGSLQKAADDGRLIAVVMFGIAALFFTASFIHKCQHDVGCANGVRTVKALSRRRRNTRQAVDLVV